MVMPKGIWKIAARAAGLVAVAAPMILLASELNRTALFNSAGYRAEGQKFGIKIGDQRSAAIAQLERTSNIRLHHTSKGGTCLMRTYDSSVIIDVFIDNSWRHGSICLASLDNKIHEISWLFGSP